EPSRSPWLAPRARPVLTSIKQRLLLPVAFRVAVRLGLLLLRLALALDGVPVHQLDRRRHDADERRALHRLVALAAAGRHLVLHPAELHRLAARRLQHELVE